jgi:hypothetical protein
LLPPVVKREIFSTFFLIFFEKSVFFRKEFLYLRLVCDEKRAFRAFNCWEKRKKRRSVGVIGRKIGASVLQEQNRQENRTTANALKDKMLLLQ